MKKNLLTILILLICFRTNVVVAQNVPNPGFENWTAGNPDNWSTNNIPGVVVPITQTSPHNGLHALKGEVLSSIAGNFSPYLTSTNMTGNGFHVNQAFATLSFYYKFNKVTTGIFTADAVMLENAGGGGYAGKIFTSSVSSFTLASLPFYYATTNPDTCIIAFSIDDTVTFDADPGNYFIIDDLLLSGLVGVEEPMEPAVVAISKIQPNPVGDFAYIYYSLPANENLKFELFNIDGKISKVFDVQNETAGKHKIELSVGELPGGIYLLRMSTPNASSSARVVVVR